MKRAGDTNMDLPPLTVEAAPYAPDSSGIVRARIASLAAARAAR